MPENVTEIPPSIEERNSLLEEITRLKGQDKIIADQQRVIEHLNNRINALEKRLFFARESARNLTSTLEDF